MYNPSPFPSLCGVVWENLLNITLFRSSGIPGPVSEKMTSTVSGGTVLASIAILTAGPPNFMLFPIRFVKISPSNSSARTSMPFSLYSM
ncbi:MAG: hypothetical protein A4E42_01534 [Methanoregulaceae archaeon PtaU1.Bin222]|nr:MAG: hypothetical protein A4E42_01534 [Methanoregulaceae archaeon PtaU1.Bin222]